MKMQFGQMEVQVQIRKTRQGKSKKLERAYKHKEAMRHYEKSKEKVITEYFFTT